MNLKLRNLALAVLALALFISLPAPTKAVLDWPNLDVLDEYPGGDNDSPENGPFG